MSRDATRDSQLLIDEFLPRYDFAVVHASVLRARPEACYRAALGVDLLRDPVIRTLLGIRLLPQRLADRLARRHGTRRRRLNPRPPSGWVTWSATAGSSSRSGRTSSSSSDRSAARGGRLGRRVDQRVDPTAFADFDRPGFAKIAANLRVEPYGATASILTIETRVTLTDPQSLRRFTRYWTFIRPFSALIRRIALRLVAADLRDTPPSAA